MEFALETKAPSLWPRAKAKPGQQSSTAHPAAEAADPLERAGGAIPKIWVIDRSGWTILTDLTEQPVGLYSKCSSGKCHVEGNVSAGKLE
jgi:hypothetical protein